MWSGQSLEIVVADDHVIFRQGLKAILREQGFEVVGEASDGRAAVRMCQTLHPDIAILDIAMPLLNGIDAARAIAKECAKTKVILLTMHADETYVAASLRAGVIGYVLKSGAAASLVQAIEAALNNETYLSPGVSRIMVQAYLATVAAPADPLSGREREVLQLIAEGKNMKEIGSLLGISARTAETHRARVMAKLDIHEIAGLVRYAIEHGLIAVNQRATSC
jgi:two-component system response regulator NreC